MHARLTKAKRSCKALIVLAMLPVAGALAANPGAASPASNLRECVSKAVNAAAIAACEHAEQGQLKQRIDTLSAAISKQLDNRQRTVFESNQKAWQAFFDSEVGMLDLSLARRGDGLGPSLRPGAINLLYEQREKQLREHLHNLKSSAAP